MINKVIYSLAAILLLGACGFPVGDSAPPTSKLQADLDSIAIQFSGGDDADHVTGDLVLPDSGPNGSSIAWGSDEPGVVSAAGSVVRPANGSGTTAVLLTATASLNGESLARAFGLAVLESYDYEPTPAADPETGAIAGMTVRINYYRWRVGLAPLQWNETLASQAAAWAEQLATDGALSHDGSRSDGSGFSYVGENLASYTGAGSLSGAGFVDLWAAERPGVTADTAFTSGMASSIGHYSQLVWADSTDLGIGYAVGSDTTYVVARFGPGGNYVGQVIYPYAEAPWLDCDNDDAVQLDDADDTNPAVQ